MDWDDLDPKTKKPKPRNLETLGIEELEEYVGDLEAEIARVRAAIQAKRSVKAGAEALFKK